MNLHEWLDQPVPGRTAKSLAEELRVSKTAVSLWRKFGVPMQHMDRIERFTGGAVTAADMLRHALECRRANRAKVHAVLTATGEPAEA